MTAEELRRRLGLVPLRGEGGWYVETYRTKDRIPVEPRGGPRREERALATAIYYLLTAETFSALHRLRSDEMFHFYLGDPVEMLQLLPGGEGRVHVLGTDLASGMHPQLLVPREVWQGARIRPGGELALLGTTVSPGFDPADFELGDRATLQAVYPQYRDWIAALTR